MQQTVLGLNSSSASSWLCVFGQVTSLLCASVASSTIGDIKFSFFMGLLWGFHGSKQVIAAQSKLTFLIAVFGSHVFFLICIIIRV